MQETNIIKLSHDDLLKRLNTTENGLTSDEALHRLAQVGPNVLHAHKKRNILGLIAEQFHSSLIYLLIVASILAFALKDYNDGFIILVILLVNTGLGFFQEYRSENAIEKLQKFVSKETLVKRDGKEILVREHDLIPGDLVILREGDIVPADICLVHVSDLRLDESQLTGESEPVTKATNGKNRLAYAGSIVEEGEGAGFVFATGTATELGHIAHLSATTKRTTQYEKSLTSFSSFLIKVTFVTLALVFIFKIIAVHSTTGIVTLGLFIIALCVTVVPEAMPVIATVTLSRGAMRLAKQRVIAKTLTAVEDLGNINVLCSDKTGTLTENKLTVVKLITDDKELFKRLAMASLETLDEKRKKFQSSFDQAFLRFVPQDIERQTTHYQRLEELPFDPAARRRRVVFADGKKTYLVEIGSVETLLELSKDPRTHKYTKMLSEDGKLGLRHLAIAYKEVKYDSEGFDILKQEAGLHFVGFVALEDPLRPTAKHTILLAEKLGVKIKILSGDSREVTHYVAEKVGLINKSQIVYTGDEIAKMSDEKLSEVVEANNVFSRLNPEQKYRIIQVLKRHCNVVGYQGDGINDAPSLKLADVAIAVNNATDVAQDSADILLLGNDLNVIVNGIKSGRMIFSNINKYIRYTMVGNFGNFFALSALFLYSGATLPLLTVQLLLTSVLTDLPLLTIATDNVETTELMSPSTFSIHALMFVSIFLGSVTAIFELIYYAIVRNQTVLVAQTGLFLFLTLTGLVVIVSIRNKGHFWRAPKFSLSMKAAFLLVAILTLILIYTGITRKLFSFTTLPWSILLVTGLLTILYVFILDLVKVWFFQARVGETTH